jgi:hypothetical protein
MIQPKIKNHPRAMTMRGIVAVVTLFLHLFLARFSHATLTVGDTWDDILALQASLHPDGRAPPVYVASKSDIHGRGVFASEDLPAGTTVAVAWFDFVFTPGVNRTAGSYDGDVGDMFVNGGVDGGGGGLGGGKSEAKKEKAGGDDEKPEEDAVFIEHIGYLPQGNDLHLEDLPVSGLPLRDDTVSVNADGLSAKMKVGGA